MLGDINAASKANKKGTIYTNTPRFNARRSKKSVCVWPDLDGGPKIMLMISLRTRRENSAQNKSSTWRNTQAIRDSNTLLISHTCAARGNNISIITMEMKVDLYQIINCIYIYIYIVNVLLGQVFAVF